MTAPLRTAIYCRVSTSEQSTEGVSLAAQEARCREYAASQGWRVGQVYVDPGYSGKSLQRPAMQRLLTAVPARLFDVVLIYRLDRISRRQRDVLHLIEDVLLPAGIGLQSVSEAFDTVTPIGKAMVGMLSVFAQLERETIIERTRMGKAEAHRQGRWGGGPVPYGYQRTAHGHLEPDPTQAPWVRWLFAQAAAGRAPDALAADLMARGIPGPAGGVWHAQSVRSLLHRPIYVGDVVRLGTRTPGHHLALVTPAIWSAVADVFRQRRLGPRRPRPQFLVDALLQCPVCGDPLRGQIMPTPKNRSTASADDPVTGARYYYLCARAKRGDGCVYRYYRARSVDAQVAAQVRAWAADPNALLRVLDAEGDAVPPPPATPAAWGAERADVERRMARWYTAFEAGAIDAALLKERLAPLQATADALDAALQAVPPVDPVADRAARLAAIQALLERLPTAWEAADALGRQALVRDLIVGGTIDPETGQVTLRLWRPLPDPSQNPSDPRPVTHDPHP